MAVKVQSKASVEAEKAHRDDEAFIKTLRQGRSLSIPSIKRQFISFADLKKLAKEGKDKSLCTYIDARGREILAGKDPSVEGIPAVLTLLQKDKQK